jgi:hypothetical protein
VEDFFFSGVEGSQLVEGLGCEPEIGVHHSAEEGFLFGEDS